jgi:hypothetical protein
MQKKRDYVLAAPRVIVPGKAYPVVLVLHGDGGNGVSMRAGMPLDDVTRDEAIVAYPTGIGVGWRLYQPPALLDRHHACLRDGLLERGLHGESDRMSRSILPPRDRFARRRRAERARGSFRHDMAIRLRALSEPIDRRRGAHRPRHR